MIGEKMKELRKKKNITIAEAADVLGVAPRTYSSYEAEEREPNIATINKIADYYNVSVDYLFGRESQLNPFAALNMRVSDEKFIEAYSQFPEYAKQIFVDIMIKLSEAAEQEKKKKKP